MEGGWWECAPSSRASVHTLRHKLRIPVRERYTMRAGAWASAGAHKLGSMTFDGERQVSGVGCVGERATSMISFRDHAPDR